jgi:hypothetical protein
VFLNKAKSKRGGGYFFNKKIWFWYFDWRSQKDWSEGELTDKSLFKKTPFIFLLITLNVQKKKSAKTLYFV